MFATNNQCHWEQWTEGRHNRQWPSPGCSSPRTHSRCQGQPLRRVRGQTPLQSSLSNSYSERSSVDSAESQLLVSVPSNCMIAVMQNFSEGMAVMLLRWCRILAKNGKLPIGYLCTFHRQSFLNVDLELLFSKREHWTCNCMLFEFLTSEFELFLVVCKSNVVYAYVFGACSLFGGPLAMLMFWFDLIFDL